MHVLQSFVLQAAEQLNLSERRIPIVWLLTQCPQWTYRTDEFLGKTLFANIPPITAVLLSEYERKLAIARCAVANKSASGFKQTPSLLPQLANASLCPWEEHLTPTLP